MNLSSYMAAHKLTATALAAQLGCRVSTVTRIRDGQRRPSLEMALAIERATKGHVTAADLHSICLTGKNANNGFVTEPEPAA